METGPESIHKKLYQEKEKKKRKIRMKAYHFMLTDHIGYPFLHIRNRYLQYKYSSPRKLEWEIE